MAEPVTPPPGRLVRLGVVLPPDAEAALHVARLCDLAGVDVVWASDETQAAVIAATSSRVAIVVLPEEDDPGTRTIAVSIGRTQVEAAARASLDPALARFSDHDTAFGSLEDCQAVVARLSAEGVRDLRCVLPNTPDMHDVIAQLTAVAFARE